MNPQDFLNMDKCSKSRLRKTIMKVDPKMETVIYLSHIRL